MRSINNYLNDAIEKWGDKPYIYTKKDGEFNFKTFMETISDVKTIAKYLSSHFKHGIRFMIYSENSYEWMILDLAIMGFGGICVPADKEWTAHDLKNVMNFIDIKVVFYSKSKSEIISDISKSYSDTQFVCIEEQLDEILAKGKEIDDCMLIPQSDMNETVKIIFTSGTTSIPKAIPLSQSNLFNNWETLYQRTPMTENDVSCVFLPLNHVYSGVANFLYTIVSGMQIYLSADVPSHIQDIITVQPTVVCTVPLILKMMYLNMTQQLLSTLKNIRFLYCGGSFTELEIKKWFRENGVNLLEAYGTTETSSVIALDVLGETCIESNGTVFENLEVEIDSPDINGYGEILVKGGSLTAGYLNCPCNEQYFDSRGFFHTGDLGKLDEKRHLFLKGRKKRMLETSDGKNVYADEIEELILECNIINKVRVYLEEYKITALIYSDSEESDVRKSIEIVNEKLPEFKKVKRLHIKKDDIGSRIK